MSDFLEKMKSIFIVQTPDANNSTSSENVEKENIDISSSTEGGNATTSENAENSTITGTSSEEFYKVLFGAIEKNNQNGFDYIEFRKALANLETINPDEKTRFLSAFAGAKASGSNAETLVTSANKYLDILTSEQKVFQNAVDDQWNRQIKSKKAEIDQLNNQISDLKSQMAKIQANIESNNTQVSNLNKEIENSKTKIETTKANFDVTYKKLTDQIKGDIDRIKTYLN